MKWVLAETDAALAAMLSEEEGLHPLISRLMVNRGIRDAADARSFLSCDLSALSGPGIFSGMERAVSRIRATIEGRGLIVVYGDYDVDGVSGSALLSLVLKRLGARVESYIPDRLSEGYGLNAAALEKIKASGADLVISVDCGITAVREAAYSRSLGLDLIITDHHEFVKNSQSEALNPKGNSLPPLGVGDSNLGIVLPDAYAILH
ncbi:MAG TPA: DHH family phosphoesterase, partial [Nitrospirota bacterium]